MRDQATLLAVGGVIAIIFAVIVLAGVTNQGLDNELVKMTVTGLLGYASGYAFAEK